MRGLLPPDADSGSVGDGDLLKDESK